MLLSAFDGFHIDPRELSPGFCQKEYAELDAHPQGRAENQVPAQANEQKQKGCRRQKDRNGHPPHIFHQLYPFTLRNASVRFSRPSNTRAFVYSASSSSWYSSASPNMMENTGTSSPSAS